MITHQKMSLFDAPQGEVIVHACNSQGMWGSGIAKPFADNYPDSYKQYQNFCKQYNEMQRGTACGRSDLSYNYVNEKHWVGWMVTSHNYGRFKDSVEQIKANSALAIRELCEKLYRAHPLDSNPTINVYSNKFNSGLFSVPWEDTELILKTVLRDYRRINWIVCSPSE